MFWQHVYKSQLGAFEWCNVYVTGTMVHTDIEQGEGNKKYTLRPNCMDDQDCTHPQKCVDLWSAVSGLPAPPHTLNRWHLMCLLTKVPGAWSLSCCLCLLPGGWINIIDFTTIITKNIILLYPPSLSRWINTITITISIINNIIFICSHYQGE